MRYGDRRHGSPGVGRLASALLILVWTGCQAPAGTGPVAGPPQPREPTPQPVDAPEETAPAPASVGAALTKVGADGAPRTLGALRGERSDLVAALDRSLEWFEKPSSLESFPVAGITHEHAWTSVAVFRELLVNVVDDAELERSLRREFDYYMSSGADGRGTVLFTGYYTPAFEASRARTGVYRYPLYALPADLLKDSVTGQTLGRRFGDRIVPYPTRAEIEASEMLAGTELAWLDDLFDVYLIHVQGSAALSLTDGSTLHLGYAGNNGYDYVSVALEMVADGKISEDELSLEEVRSFFDRNPEELAPYLRRNPRFIFFREEDGSRWPLGSLGVKVTAMRSLAADKEIFPPGGVTLVVTFMTDESGRNRPVEQFMLDQDSGGAIRTPGRADIYFGIGLQAERRAGGQYAEGRLYYLFLKPDRVNVWRERLR